jgi:large subunit ribosomal protein L35
MPKLKTRTGAKKRFQVTKSGKVKHGRAYGKHMFTFAKKPSQKRRNRGIDHLSPMDAKKVTKEMFPYG